MSSSEWSRKGFYPAEEQTQPKPSRLTSELSTQETNNDVDIRKQVKRHGIVDRMRHILEETENEVYHSPLLRNGSLLPGPSNNGSLRRDASGGGGRDVPMLVIPLNIDKGGKFVRYTPSDRDTALSATKATSSTTSTTSTPISDLFATTLSPVVSSSSSASSRGSSRDFKDNARQMQSVGNAPPQYAPRLVPRNPTKGNKLKPLPALPPGEERAEDQRHRHSAMLTKLLGAPQVSERAKRVLSAVVEVIDDDDNDESDYSTDEFGKSNYRSISRLYYKDYAGGGYGGGGSSKTSSSSSSLNELWIRRRPDTNTTLKGAAETRNAVGHLGRSVSLAQGRASGGGSGGSAAPQMVRSGSLGGRAGGAVPRPLRSDAERQYSKENRSFVVVPASPPASGKKHYRNASLSGFQGSTCTGQTEF